MSRRLLRDLFGLDEAAEIRSQVAYIGDSPNDEPMFSFFEHTVGVANLAEFRDGMRYLPQWITEQPGGHGFCELADLLVRSRGG